jgi:MFS family permease
VGKKKMVMIFCIVSSGSVTNFFPTVVQTLNYGEIETLLLTAPPYVLAVLTAFANAWHADRTGERYFHITLPLYVSVVAYILAACTTSVGPRYLSMMLMVPGVYTGYVVALGWISNILPRPPAKRAAALAFINAVSNASSIYASYMYPSSAGPRYGHCFFPCRIVLFMWWGLTDLLQSSPCPSTASHPSSPSSRPRSCA